MAVHLAREKNGTIAEQYNSELITSRPLFGEVMFFIRNFQIWNAGGRVITITHYLKIYYFLTNS